MATGIDVRNNFQFIYHDHGYTTLSLYQQNMLKVIQPYVTSAARSLKKELQNDSTFTVVDYGSADGLNSVPLITQCSDELSGTPLRVTWIFNDISILNSQSVLQSVKAALHESAACGAADRVELQFVDGDFYQQVVPDSSVDLGVCASSIHWLSYKPPAGCNLDVQNPDEVTKEVAAEGWLHFLQARAKELRAGGRLVVLTYVTKEEDLGCRKLILTAPYHIISNMFKEGTITKEEYESARVAPITFGTTNDLRAPFQDPHSELGQALHLREVKTYDIEEPFYPQWRRSEGKNSEGYVQAVVNLMKSYCNAYWKVLNWTRRADARRNIIHQFYTKLETFVRETTNIYHFNVFVAIVDIEKRA